MDDEDDYDEDDEEDEEDDLFLFKSTAFYSRSLFANAANPRRSRLPPCCF